MHSYISQVSRRPFALIRAALSVLAAGWSNAAPAMCARQTLTRTDFRTVPANSAYELLFWLRPEILRTALGVAGTASQPTVYINDTAAGPLSVLSDIPVSNIAAIRYLPPAEAFKNYGPMYCGGIVVVRTRW